VEFASSLHVPVEVNGMQAIVSFWSEEPSAFPPETHELLERIAKRVAESR